MVLRRPQDHLEGTARPLRAGMVPRHLCRVRLVLRMERLRVATERPRRLGDRLGMEAGSRLLRRRGLRLLGLIRNCGAGSSLLIPTDLG